MSAKVRDNKKRWRNKTVGFRVSPEEWEEIERLVHLSGMSKQEYIMSRLENREMVIRANPRVVKALRNEIITLQQVIIGRIDWQEDDALLERLTCIVTMVGAIGGMR